MTQAPPHPFRVLVVEDEPLIGMSIEDVLEEMGWEVVGPAAGLSQAVALAKAATFDCAILDVNVRGGHIYPLAEMLLDRGIPLLFASGYANWTAPDRLVGQARLSKPFTSAQLEHELRVLGERVIKQP